MLYTLYLLYLLIFDSEKGSNVASCLREALPLGQVLKVVVKHTDNVDSSQKDEVGHKLEREREREREERERERRERERERESIKFWFPCNTNSAEGSRFLVLASTLCTVAMNSMEAIEQTDCGSAFL